MKIRKSKTIDFTSIFKGYKIPIPFFLLSKDIYEKIENLSQVKCLKPLIILWFGRILPFFLLCIGKKNQKMILGKQKIAETVDFSNFQGGTTVFLIMIDIQN